MRLECKQDVNVRSLSAQSCQGLDEPGATLQRVQDRSVKPNALRKFRSGLSLRDL